MACSTSWGISKRFDGESAGDTELQLLHWPDVYCIRGLQHGW